MSTEMNVWRNQAIPGSLGIGWARGSPSDTGKKATATFAGNFMAGAVALKLSWLLEVLEADARFVICYV